MENSAAAGAMTRRSVLKRSFEEMNKDEDEETNTLLGTMEENQAETSFVDDDGEQLKENIDNFPEIGWDALRLDLDDDEDWEELKASLVRVFARERDRNKKEMREPERWLRMEEPETWMAAVEPEVLQEKADPEETDFIVSLWEGGKYRDDWNAIYSGTYGSYEDTTRIPAMRFTHNPAPPELGVNTCNTIQVFSAKVASTRGGLQWPIDVFGLVAIRDDIDYSRNIIFNRTRESCQTLTEEDHNLVPAGPSRAVVVSGPHPLAIEVELKVKGTTESEDKDLSLLAVPMLCTLFDSRLFHCSYTSKLSTLEFTLGHLVSSLEATIFARAIHGSWPDGFRCEISAFVSCKNIGYDKNAADIDHEKIALFNSRGEKGIVDNDGNIKLSRRVVSVEIRGELKVSFKAWKVDDVAVEREVVFTPSTAGLSHREIHIGLCAIEVSVAWSLISDSPVTAETVL